MFKQWLKQFIAVCICLITILSPLASYLTPTTAYAEDYVLVDDEDDTNGADYFIVEGEDFEKLFDFGLSEVDDIVSWVQNFKTYTVIKELGEDEYKMYFNTPNLQSIVKNRVISMISDGYNDDTYNINDTEWIVDVGHPNEAGTSLPVNAITKYGFQISSPIYMGEYPKETMSAAGIVPTSFWEGVWRAVKSVFGASFIDAPSSSNFNTITYINHGYSDKNTYVVEFFKKYYLPYFEGKIAEESCDNGDEYFNGPEDLIAETVTEEEYLNAVLYNDMHAEEYAIASAKYEVWTLIQARNGETNTIMSQHSYTQNGTFDMEFPPLTASDCETCYGTDSLQSYICSLDKYKTYFHEYANSHKKQIYVLCAAYASSSGAPTTAYDLMGIPELTTYSDSSWTVPEDCSNLALACNKSHDKLGALRCDYTYTKVNEDETTEEVTVTDVSVADAALDGHLEDITKIYASGLSGADYTDLSGLLSFWGTGSYCSSAIEWEESDFVDDNSRIVFENYNRNEITKGLYEDFIEHMDHGENPEDADDGMGQAEILYRQCMIPNDGEDGECWSNKYGDGKTTITVANVYAYSGLYKITRGNSNYYTNESLDSLKWDYDENGNEVYVELSDADVYKIINKLQSYCGPYYTIVLSNMIKLMCMTALYDGDIMPMFAMQEDDPRVMPYDVDTLITDDAENYDCTDPRVDIYKSHIIGGLVSDFTINWGFSIFIKPQITIINIAGRITEFSVFLQQLCNFDKFDEWGLSPTTMWNNAYIGLVISLLALYFIIKTVIAVIKMGTGNGNIGRITMAFLVFFLELGILLAIQADPEGMWNTVKKADEKIMSLGERMTPSFNNEDLHYLFGDNEDIEVMYYLPYLDTWAKFNTGYGLMDDEQLIDYDTDTAELKEYEPVKIGDSEINHYCVLLMDSISYYGDSSSVMTSVLENGKTYNGNSINNNAYRVVDHFLAPRVNIESQSDGDLELSVTENENFNGQFQGGGGSSFIDMLVKLLNCILMCILSLIKFMTFLWQWFMFYIFIFKVVLGKGPENKTWPQILAETFSPTLCIIFIGMYSGIIMSMSMELSGLIGLMVEISLFVLTLFVFRWWKKMDRNGMLFPATLGWLYIITNLNQHKRDTYVNELNEDFARDAKMNGLAEFDEDGNEIDYKTLEGQRKGLFNKNGNYKVGNDIDGKHKEQYERFYRHLVNTQKLGYELSDEQRAAYDKMRSDKRFAHLLEEEHKNSIPKRYRKFAKNDEQNDNSTDKELNNSSDDTSNNSDETSKNTQTENDKGGDADE